MKEKEQSSIEWLENRVLYMALSSQKSDMIKFFDKAKELHKKEIIEAYNQGYREGELDQNLTMDNKDVSDYDNGVNYYNEKYSQ